MFPSPRGDELFLSCPRSIVGTWQFPSPRGDELFQWAECKILSREKSFRPLAGMSCFRKGFAECFRVLVSVPSRG